MLGLVVYFEYSQKRTDIFCYFYFEIVQRHIQISPPNPVILGFNIGIQITITLVIIFCPKCSGIFLIPISPLFWTGILQVKWISIKIVIWSSNISSNVNISQIFPHLHSRLKQLINVKYLIISKDKINMKIFFWPTSFYKNYKKSLHLYFYWIFSQIFLFQNIRLINCLFWTGCHWGM